MQTSVPILAQGLPSPPFSPTLPSPSPSAGCREAGLSRDFHLLSPPPETFCFCGSTEVGIDVKVSLTFTTLFM